MRLKVPDRSCSSSSKEIPPLSQSVHRPEAHAEVLSDLLPTSPRLGWSSHFLNSFPRPLLADVQTVPGAGGGAPSALPAHARGPAVSGPQPVPHWWPFCRRPARSGGFADISHRPVRALPQRPARGAATRSVSFCANSRIAATRNPAVRSRPVVRRSPIDRVSKVVRIGQAGR